MIPELRERLGRQAYGLWFSWAVEHQESGLASWDELEEHERELHRLTGEALFNVGITGAIAVCETRADNERVYTPGAAGEAQAAPYLRAIEDIKAYAEDGKLRPIGGAYAGLTAKKGPP